MFIQIWILKMKKNKQKERPSVFTKHKNLFLAQKNTTLLMQFWNSITKQQREAGGMMIFRGYQDQMLSLKGCILSKGPEPTGTRSNPSRRLVSQILGRSVPKLLSLMPLPLIALRNFSQFEIIQWKSITLFCELRLSFCILLGWN